ncbi:hypothetical protein FGO68_gene1747 [Halteria grandinella]|uniref:Uncharacterized protein n=1 Tax=Halteria grandinella TaxID=5974 RepID=A0A8J8NQ46_HALGN|nr:hypothetical protein FGO68_gene1747 [Halteria grandinella]
MLKLFSKMNAKDSHSSDDIDQRLLLGDSLGFTPYLLTHQTLHSYGLPSYKNTESLYQQEFASQQDQFISTFKSLIDTPLNSQTHGKPDSKRKVQLTPIELMRADHEAKLHTLQNKVELQAKSELEGVNTGMTKRFMRLKDATEKMIAERESQMVIKVQVCEPQYTQTVNDRKKVVQAYIDALIDLEDIDEMSRWRMEDLIFKELRVDKNSLTLETVEQALKELNLTEGLKNEALLQRAQFLLQVILIHLAIITDQIIVLKGKISDPELILAILWTSSPPSLFITDPTFKPRLPLLKDYPYILSLMKLISVKNTFSLIQIFCQVALCVDLPLLIVEQVSLVVSTEMQAYSRVDLKENKDPMADVPLCMIAVQVGIYLTSINSILDDQSSSQENKDDQTLKLKNGLKDINEFLKTKQIIDLLKKKPRHEKCDFCIPSGSSRLDYASLIENIISKEG